MREPFASTCHHAVDQLRVWGEMSRKPPAQPILSRNIVESSHCRVTSLPLVQFSF
jgi:hypothetical protein